MITWPSLNAARLGNQLFGMAATLAYAARRNDVARFPPWKSARYFAAPDGLFGAVPSSTAFYDQPSLAYDAIPERGEAGEVVELRGNFISYKFFAGYEDVVRAAFAPRVPRERTDCVALHVRRTDYIGGPYVDLSVAWYEAQMAQFPGARFLCFSDDIPWCREAFAHREMVYALGTAEEDLLTMTLCAGHIVANSTFSWWGAWLAGHNNVIAPRHYHTEAFRAGTPHIQKWEDHDLWPPAWRLVDT